MRPDAQKQWPRRPPRLGRLFNSVRPFYFVTFNTYQHQSFLARPEVHQTFCVFCAKAQEHDVAVGRYVIMPNHVHFFAAFPMDGITLASWVQSLRDRSWQNTAAYRHSKATLARGLLRPSTAQPRELLPEMGLCAHESCARTTEQNSGRMAVSRRNCSDSISMRNVAVAASLCRGVAAGCSRLALSRRRGARQSTATERRGYT
jgi:hypothetical protein